MDPALLVVVSVFLVLAGAHSILGERFLIAPLLAASWPPLPFGRGFGKRTLRMAWHVTSVAWVTLAALVAWPSSLRAIVGASLLVSALVAYVTVRGAHFAWAFFWVGGIAAVAPLLPSGSALGAAVAAGLLVAISALHVAWAAGWTWGLKAAVPEVDGRPAFQPPRTLTLLVAFAFAGGAAVAGLTQVPDSPSWVTWLARAGAVVCGVRAWGDFRWSGLFKRERRTTYGRLDDALYTPLCILLSTGFALTG
jgi:hypothetical protein